MRVLFKDIMRGAVLCAMVVNNSHAGFLDTLNKTVTQVQQAVESTKQAVDSTTKTVNDAPQTIDSTKNTVGQAQQIPAQVNQTPDQPAQDIPAIGKHTLALREATLAKERQRAGAAIKYPYSGKQFAMDERGFINQLQSDVMQIAQRYTQQLKKDPNYPQYEADLNAAHARHYDRMEQFYRDVQVGAAGAKSSVSAPPKPEQNSGESARTSGSNVIDDIGPVTLGITLGMSVADVRKLLSAASYKLILGPKDGNLAAYAVVHNDGTIPRDFKLYVHAYPIIAKSGALAERDLIVLVLSGMRDFELRQAEAPDKKTPTLNDAVSYYQNTYGPIYALHDGGVEFRPDLSFTSHYSIADIETPPPAITDPSSPIVICHRALVKLQTYAAFTGGSQAPAPQVTFQDNLRNEGASPLFGPLSKQCSRMMEVRFISRGVTMRSTPLSTIHFLYGDTYRLEDIYNALANTKRKNPGNKIVFAPE